MLLFVTNLAFDEDINAKLNFVDSFFIIHQDFLMFYQIFLSLQVKRRVNITCNHGRNESRLRILKD